MSSPFSPAEAERIAREGPAYRAAMEYIYQRLNYERVSHDSYNVEDFRLARMTRLLELLGNPQEKLRYGVAHVAGTKGKGSTSAMLASMLKAAGIRTGLFTSPHILRFEERMTVNGVEPTPAEIVALVEQLKPAVEQLVTEMPPGPTYFEVTTALAWLHFVSKRCDTAVMEVGLGGRLDSTNVCKPQVSIITSISRDHTRLLGDTLPLIAAEKAGIIKPGVPVITGVDQPEVLAVIEQFATEANAPLYRLGREIKCEIDSLIETDGLPRYRVNVETFRQRYEGLIAPLPGVHQCRNLALAVTAFDCFLAGPDLPCVREGLANFSWPLRIEQLSARPRIIIDTAHNDASMAALCETLAPLKHRRRVLIFATSRDKDAPAMLRILNTAFDEVLLTRYIHNPRALPIDQLSAIAESTLTIPWQTAPDPAAAWAAARQRINEDDLVCVTGSVFLAAEMQALLKDAAP
ncbi:MAG TPA: folylpolyglutamate synthase/dihydrofolate synthase family protein [Caulifigura sp.]|nr:folylpolyglutamate synthase/dihydrofolate synthase family protein [Caulifigura sp.]